MSEKSWDDELYRREREHEAHLDAIEDGREVQEYIDEHGHYPPDPAPVNEWDARLRELARLEARFAARKPVIDAMHKRFHELYVEPYERELAAMQGDIDALREAIRADARQHFLDTGDKKMSDYITPRIVEKWRYDKDAALEMALDRGDAQFVRVKKSLDVRAFEDALKRGAVSGYDAEPVREVVIAIEKTGDLALEGTS